MIVESPEFVSKPVVSILVITYNQEKTISQTIEGIIEQKCDFPIEIIIGEDASNDNTREICLEYQKKYPEKIKLLLQSTNQGVLKNYIDVLLLCRGKYIAQCAGDDYWIDAEKLAKQVRFFEDNLDYGVVSTGGYRLIVKSNTLKEGIAPLNPVPDGNAFPFTHKEGVYAMPLSLMFKRDLLKHIDFDQFILRQFSVEDVPIQTIMAKHTKFGHIPDLTCVYRVYSESMTYTSVSHPGYIAYHEGLVAMKRYLAELYPGEIDFSEEWANDYLAYKKARLAIYKFDYNETKKQLAKLINVGPQERKVMRFTSNRLLFYISCILRRAKYIYSKFSSYLN
jgi:glycosyltransferase involved in cell wall biosynthesis